MPTSAYAFCPLCGSRLEDRMMDGDKLRRACVSCSFVYYANPTPAAGVVVVDGRAVLLVKRKYEPKAGLWTLPAGFVEAGEEVAGCAVRETKEETNLDVRITRIFDVYSAFDDPRTAVVLVLYLAERVGGELKCGDDASDARFFDLDALPEDVAFRAHRKALADLRRRFADGTL
jgi:ADP-ribose pyrophosphatase YjhB (NUDIX family)